MSSGFEYRDLTVKLETATSFWLRLLEFLEKRKDGMISILSFAIKDVYRFNKRISLYSLSQKELQVVYSGVLWFISGGRDIVRPAKSAKKAEAVISYTQDIDAIYAAFLQVYKIDLWQYLRTELGKNIYFIDELHYWKFKALLENLPEGNLLKDMYIKYRVMDLRKLPAKTEADRKYLRELKEIKKSVAIISEDAAETDIKENAFERMLRDKKNA